MAPYCGHNIRGICRYGPNCRFSHEEEDKPAEMKKVREAAFQWTLVCVLCNIKIVEENEWFGLTECPHPFCVSCLQNTQKTSPKKGKKSAPAAAAAAPKATCPECSEKIDNFCPSGIFFEKKEERKKALQYFQCHENGIWEAYGNRHRRTAKCGFKTACTRKFNLPDGSVLCQHNRFDNQQLESIQTQKKKEWEAEKRKDERNREIIRKAAEIKSAIWQFLIFLVAIGLVIQYALFLLAQSGLMAEETHGHHCQPYLDDHNLSGEAIPEHFRFITRENSRNTCQTVLRWSMTRIPIDDSFWNVEVFDGNGRLVDNFCFDRGASTLL